MGLARAARDLVGRARAWRGRSISNQITAAAVTLSLPVAAVFGAATFFAVSALVARNIESALESQARLVEQRLASDLLVTARDLADLAENSFIANGLVDSAGRDTYLLPFLREHRHPAALRAAVVLCDFKGAPVASNDSAMAAMVAGIRGVGQALGGARLHGEIVSEGGIQYLVLSHPVVFPPTGQVEGAVVERLDLAELLAGATAFLGPEEEALLAVGGVEVASGNRGGGPLQASVTRRPRLPAPLSGMEVSLRVGTRAPVHAPLRWVAVLYLVTGVATVVVVVRTSRAVARRLAGPIESLSRAASRIAAGGELALAAPVGGPPEVGALAAALSDMLGKLRASQEELEQRVRERTAELQGREQELKRYAGTQAVLLREVNHRVKNNLAAIISVLHLEESRARAHDGGGIPGVLDELESRIRSLATVHGLLSSAEWQPLPLGDLCLKLLRSSLGSGKGTAPELQVDPSPVRVESGQAHHLALVLNELATNSLKHGRRDGEAGRVEVRIAGQGTDVVLTYRDHGPGFPAAVLEGAPEAVGTGLQLLRGIVETSLGGTLSLLNRDGAVVEIRFTCQPPASAGGPP